MEWVGLISKEIIKQAHLMTFIIFFFKMKKNKPPVKFVKFLWVLENQICLSIT